MDHSKIEQFIVRWFGLSFIACGALFFTLVFFFGTRELAFVGASSAEFGEAARERAKATMEPVLPKSPLTGLPCEGAERRPLAVMLASDPEARPLSGITEADLVIEMPVTMNQITRFMAFYQCAEPAEIGSVRSARHDFLPLAAGFNAIYAHWGGSHFALDKLRTGALDDIDALVNPFDSYWRKNNIPAPHNGFTSYARLQQAAEQLAYRIKETGAAPGFTYHESQPQAEGRESAATITIPYGLGESEVRWNYEPETHTYKRLRGGRPEHDKVSNTDVEATTVIVMRTAQAHLEAQYTDTKVVGSGSATIYEEGIATPAHWHKEGFSSPLRFMNDAGADISFTPGKKWIEIVTQ